MRQILGATLVLLSCATPAVAQFASEHDRREAFRHYRAGQELLSAEQFEKAAIEFQLAIDKDRLLTLAHYGLGQTHMALKRYTSAVLAFTGCREAFQTLHHLQERDRQAVERQRDDELLELRDAARRVQQGDIKMGSSGMVAATVARIESRIQDLERQRSSNTRGFVAPPEVSLSLGSAYFRYGQLADAEREWKAAVDANSCLGEAHNNLAALYAMTSRKAEAEASARAAQKAGFRMNPRLLEDIRKLPSRQ